MDQQAPTCLQDPPEGDIWINLGFHDIVVLGYRVESSKVDLWKIYRADPKGFSSYLTGHVNKCFGSDMEIAISFQQGSLWVNIVARFKNAWTATGRRVAAAAKAVKKNINISAIGNKIKRLIIHYYRLTRGFLISPEVREVYRVFSDVAFIGFITAEMFGFIPAGSHSAIVSILERWAGVA